ncbi:carbohydrate binding domain-containing protein [Catenovulum sp. 2E275]|uniref:carbohydrate binding domain-containing protein n=1 Tax=Catenovulum sp. 2E275 TaxID=2980497 RepID=UPI0021CF17D0|nr:carbohydrate binding domain-containing protein [Catenovulum sp. 2E275]MCU4674067.1 carbohydrate binding domain-containing protein [Catenovulum sp. 2E275]
MFKFNKVLILMLATGVLNACSLETDEESSWTGEVIQQNQNDNTDTEEQTDEQEEEFPEGVAYQTSFEDGTISGWTSQGEIGLTTVQDAQDGVYALKASGRIESWNAPAVVLTDYLEAGKTYNFSAWVKLSGTASANINITMKTTVEGVDPSYDGITEAVAATDTDWVEVTGTFTYEEVDDTVTEILAFVEGPDAGVDYLIDNFVISEAEESDENNNTTQAIYTTNFDDGTIGDWSPLGGIMLEAVTDAKAGTYALKTTGRTAGWNAPGVELIDQLTVGETYQFSFWTKLVDISTAGIKASIRYDFDNSDSVYKEVLAVVDANDTDWVQLVGEYTINPYPEEDADDSETTSTEAPTTMFLYVESTDESASYIIDEFEILPPEPAVVE